MSGTYISSGDFNNLVAGDFNMSGYIDDANTAIERLAYSKGVSPSDIYTPVDILVREYGKEYAYCALFLDKMGANNPDDPTSDKYLVLYNIHNEKLQQIRKDITSEMISGDADSPNECSSTSTLFRG
jgi:hypothetical protein